jgi:3-isopropylmalate/(R)-2-methylmalate dehydratase large subunit
MGQTLSQKIIALHAGRDEAHAGEILEDVKVDIALGNDITIPLAIKELQKYHDAKGNDVRVWNPQNVAFILDHFTPNKDIKSAEQCKMIREFAKKQGLKYFFEPGRVGIEHILLPEQGIVLPYDLVIGADSHTCTYGAIGAFSTGVGSTDLAGVLMTGKVWLRVPEAMKFVFNGNLSKYAGGKDVILKIIGDIGVDGARYASMEFTGENDLSVSDRLTISNMAVEAGAKNGIFEVDIRTLTYMLQSERFKENTRLDEFEDLQLKADEDAEYTDVREYDLSKMELQVAFPHLPSNTHPISEVQENPIYVEQVVFGACTNGKLEDLEAFAEVLKGHKVHPDVRLIVIPGTQYIWRQGVESGIAKMVSEAGGFYSGPTCGPCLGGHMGCLAKGEKALATTNRNFVGRMGHPESEVYLAGPAVAAATAVKGHICGPGALK